MRTLPFSGTTRTNDANKSPANGLALSAQKTIHSLSNIARNDFYDYERCCVWWQSVALFLAMAIGAFGCQYGGSSDAWMRHGADARANILPHASRKTLAEQTHDVDFNVLAPVIIEFFEQ